MITLPKLIHQYCRVEIQSWKAGNFERAKNCREINEYLSHAYLEHIHGNHGGALLCLDFARAAKIAGGSDA